MRRIMIERAPVVLSLTLALGSASSCTSASAEDPSADADGGSSSTTDPSSGDVSESSTSEDDGSSSGNAVGPDLSAFEAELDAFLAEHDLTGATAVVVHVDDGVLLERGFGTFEADRISLLASASKMITAGVVVRLHDEGVLDLDAPISEYVGTWGPRDHDPTLAQMLSNSSGMVGLIDAPLYGPYLCQYLESGTLAACGEEIYAADDGDDVVPPDTAFRYGGGQWQLAGAVAQVASGQSWDELLAATYRDPCGIDVLGYTNPYQASFAGGGTDSATAYPTYFNGDLADLPSTDNPNMEGGGYATAGAYGSLLLMHLREGQCPAGTVLQPESVARMRTDRVARWGIPSGEESGLDGYGLGWWTMSEHPDVALSPGAFGAVPWIDVGRGYGAMIIFEADTQFSMLAFRRLRPVLEAAFDAES